MSACKSLFQSHLTNSQRYKQLLLKSESQILHDPGFILTLQKEQVEQYNELAMLQLKQIVLKKCDYCSRQFEESKYQEHQMHCNQYKSNTNGYKKLVTLDNNQLVQIYAPGPPQQTSQSSKSSEDERKYKTVNQRVKSPDIIKNNITVS